MDLNKMNVAQLMNQELARTSDQIRKPKALQDKPDKTFYLAYDFMNKNNPWFHHTEFYSFDGVKKPRSTTMINNISFVVTF